MRAAWNGGARDATGKQAADPLLPHPDGHRTHPSRSSSSFPPSPPPSSLSLFSPTPFSAEPREHRREKRGMLHLPRRPFLPPSRASPVPCPPHLGTGDGLGGTPREGGSGWEPPGMGREGGAPRLGVGVTSLCELRGWGGVGGNSGTPVQGSGWAELGNAGNSVKCLEFCEILGIL